MDYYNYLKSLHLIFVITWFAGLFYIVRLFVYQIESFYKPSPEKEILGKQLKLMSKRLWYIITWPSAILATIFAVWLLILQPYWLEQPWMHVKLLFVILLIIYHLKTHQYFKQLQNDEVKKTSSFMRIWNEGATFILFAVFRGLQNTSWAMQISILGGLVNLLADYVLIFGFGPIPSFGVEGAAYGSLIAQIVMLFFAIFYLNRKTIYRIYWASKIHADLKWLFGMSIDFYVRTISLNLAFYQATRMASALGEAVMAAHTIAINIWLFSAFFIDGYANAGNALSGRLFGEGNFSELKKMVRSILIISIAIGSVLGLIYLSFYRSIATLFSEDKLVIDYFLSIFWIVILMQPLNAVAFAYDGIFKGLGEAKLLRNTLLISTFLVFFPFAWFSNSLDWGFYAVWGSILIWMISRGGLLAFAFRKWMEPYLNRS